VFAILKQHTNSGRARVSGRGAVRKDANRIMRYWFFKGFGFSFSFLSRFFIDWFFGLSGINGPDASFVDPVLVILLKLVFYQHLAVFNKQLFWSIRSYPNLIFLKLHTLPAGFFFVYFRHSKSFLIKLFIQMKLLANLFKIIKFIFPRFFYFINFFKPFKTTAYFPVTNYKVDGQFVVLIFVRRAGEFKPVFIAGYDSLKQL